MKRPLWILCFLILALLAAGCTLPVVTVPGPTPAPTPAGGNWERIQQTGTLVVGTSADYPPFAYYDDTFRLTGFDPALVRELGERMGLEVQIKDIPFEGLTDALNAGQIDVAASAISVTPERHAEMDFTDIYYISEDAFLAHADADVTGLASPAEVEQQALVGVQEGSVYQQWAERELVETGVLPAANLLLYSDAERAVNDLDRGRIDLVIMDLIPAQRFAEELDVKIVAQGLNRQRYAMAVPRGANELRRELNAALDLVRDDGTLNLLAFQFFGLEAGEMPTPPPTATPTATQTPTATPTPTATHTATPVPPTPRPTATRFVPPTPTRIPPTATPLPPPTATPIPVPTRCVDSMTWVSDLTFDDHNMSRPPVLLPGQAFVKAWRIRNTGSCTWDNTYRLAFVRGNVQGAQMSGQPVYINGFVRPNSVYDIEVPLIAPITPGTYQGFWQMYNSRNEPFGQRIWVGIRVAPPITATPRPTQTPAPQIEFSADDTSIRAGQPVLFRWNVENVREVYFFREGQNWWEHGVAGQGSRTEYPSRDTSYFLRVVKRDNTVELREIRISVAPAPQAPQIRQFSVVPEGQIVLGECVQIDWEVRGDVDDVDIKRNGEEIWEDAPLGARLQDCPQNARTYEYRIEAEGPGGISVATRYVDVVRPTQPTATPTATPTTTPQPTPTATSVPAAVVQQFSVTPERIEEGQCVEILWSVGGDPALVRILRSGTVIYDNAPVNGSGQDCLNEAGEYLYRIEVTNRAGVISDAREVLVTVVAVAPPTATPEAESPAIDTFASSAPEINLGECVTLSWSYRGGVPTMSSLLRNDEKLLGDILAADSFIDCPPGPGEYLYRLQVASEAGVMTEATLVVVVLAPIVPTNN